MSFINEEAIKTRTWALSSGGQRMLNNLIVYFDVDVVVHLTKSLISQMAICTFVSWS